MKLAAREVAGFLKSPGPDRHAILIYGNDRGLVRERVETLALGVVDDLGGPFRVPELQSAKGWHGGFFFVAVGLVIGDVVTVVIDQPAFGNGFVRQDVLFHPRFFHFSD